MPKLITGAHPRFASGPAHGFIDPQTESGAKLQAHAIMKAWRKAGCDTVRAWEEKVAGTLRQDGRSTGGYWIVRSNLRNGMPPR